MGKVGVEANSCPLSNKDCAAHVCFPGGDATACASLEQILNGSAVATFVIDRGHLVTHWNHACELLTGMPAAEIIGTRQQWRAFYTEQRPVMADLILDEARASEVQHYYPDKFKPSSLIDGAFEAEDFFPGCGDSGRWLYFTASPLRDATGQVVGAIETLQDFTERRRAETALKESEDRYRLLSITDHLTGLFNTRHFYEQLELESARAARYNHCLSLLMLDVDHFKRFNDTYGHPEGDRVLQRLAHVMRNCLRISDSAYRLGGEEFIVLLPETGLDEACLIAERLRGDFAANDTASVNTDRVTVSIGVASRVPTETTRNFVRRADDAAYLAKHLGRNRVAMAASEQLVSCRAA